MLFWISVCKGLKGFRCWVLRSWRERDFRVLIGQLGSSGFSRIRVYLGFFFFREFYLLIFPLFQLLRKIYWDQLSFIWVSCIIYCYSFSCAFLRLCIEEFLVLKTPIEKPMPWIWIEAQNFYLLNGFIWFLSYMYSALNYSSDMWRFDDVLHSRDFCIWSRYWGCK